MLVTEDQAIQQRARDSWPAPETNPRLEPLNTRILDAARHGDARGAEDILLQGPDLRCHDDKGQTPLHLACANGDPELIKLLILHGSEVETRDFLGNTPLHVACSTKHHVAAAILLKAGANVNSLYNDGSIPLHVAADCGDDGLAMAALLIESGADVDMKDNAGRTPLHKAAIEGSREITELLLESRAKVDIVDNMGFSALHFCTVGKNVEVMDVLLRAGAEVNLKDVNGDTVLHRACEEQWERSMHALLRYGADPRVGNRNGMTAIELAEDVERYDIVRILRRGPRSPDSSRSGSRRSRADTRTTLRRRRMEELSDEDDVRIRPTREPRARDSSSDEDDRYRHRHVRRVRNYSDNRTTPRYVDIRNVTYSSDGDIQRVVTEPVEEIPEEIPEAEIPEAESNTWAGVRRDNGDGFTLASYNNHDISFDAKLESVVPDMLEGQGVHSTQIKLNFMRPYSMDHRIRYANVDVRLAPRPSPSADTADGPIIRDIMPQADRMEVSDQEITSGQKFTVGAAGAGGPSNVNISMEGSKSRTATFKGVRIIHGAVRDRMHASWRLYEEPGSKSGLPEIVRLLLLVHCETEFDLRLSMSVKACHLFTFGIPRTLTAPSGPCYTVPQLSTIIAYERQSRLKQMLDVADRAATIVEEAKRLDQKFTEAIKEHKKRHLIMEAGQKENHDREWTAILDDSRYSDFRTLRDKLLDLDLDHASRRREIRQRHDDYVEIPIRRLSPRRGARGDVRFDRHYSYDREYSGRLEDTTYRGTQYATAPAKNFSAVGPGYKVSRLA